MVGLLTVLALGHEVTQVLTDPEVPGLSHTTRSLIGCGFFRDITYYIAGETINLAKLHDDYKPDLFLCVHGRRIIPAASLKLFKHGGVNVHPFLQDFPGAAPVERAIDRGSTAPLSVSAHRMADKVDEGEVLATASFEDGEVLARPIKLQLYTPEEVYNMLYELYARVIAEILGKLEAGK